MSLLYECINGIIQGGILDNTDDVAGADEIATLCVNKLRGMIMMNGDANRKSSLPNFFFLISSPFYLTHQDHFSVVNIIIK